MGEEFNVCLVLIMPSALSGLLSSPLLYEEICFCVLIARQMGDTLLGKVVGTPLWMTFGLGLFLTLILCIYCWFRRVGRQFKGNRAGCQQLIEQQCNCFAFILCFPQRFSKCFQILVNPH